MTRRSMIAPLRAVRWCAIPRHLSGLKQPEDPSSLTTEVGCGRLHRADDLNPSQRPSKVAALQGFPAGAVSTWVSTWPH